MSNEKWLPTTVENLDRLIDIGHYHVKRAASMEIVASQYVSRWDYFHPVPVDPAPPFELEPEKPEAPEFVDLRVRCELDGLQVEDAGIYRRLDGIMGKFIPMHDTQYIAGKYVYDDVACLDSTRFMSGGFPIFPKAVRFYRVDLCTFQHEEAGNE